MSVVAAPHTQEQLVAAFKQQHSDSLAYWNAFDTSTFFQKIGSSWSPAETVRHLTKSTRPVVKALAIPKIGLRLMFGKPRRASQTFEQFRAGYLKALSEGGQAGRFAPSSSSEDDREAWRAAIMRQFESVNRGLQDQIMRWPDARLDRFQLPHPLLGKLTVREMLFFTLYHQQHHIDVVERRMRSGAT